MIRLGVNIDHIATLRNARGESHPNILKAAQFVMKCGADLITIHLREDRRHIKEFDIKEIKSKLKIPLNLEIAATNEMLNIALKSKPDILLLDNLNLSEIKKAISQIDNKCLIEVSGIKRPEDIKKYKNLPIHYISLGDLTKNIKFSCSYVGNRYIWNFINSLNNELNF